MMIQKVRSSSIISILIQILVWMVFAVAVLFNQPFTGNITVPYQLWLKEGIVLAMLVAAYYTNSLVFVPRFLLKNHTAYYFLLVIATIVFILVINKYADGWLNLHELMMAAFRHHGPPQRPRGNRNSLDVVTLVIAALVLGIGTSITAIQKWQADKLHNQVLQQEKTTSELSFLKAQINPHFFFNTLNNIYALTYVDAEVSRKAIHQLSRMMRYLLYDTLQSTTLLSQEISFINDYISLMQLRLTDMVNVGFESPAELNDLPIAPMLFLPFVENAFKHGTSVNEPGSINIQIKQQDNLLELTVKNAIVNTETSQVDEYGGIGLDNTRRRLDLLYPGKYQLLINDVPEPGKYIIHLSLDLV